VVKVPNAPDYVEGMINLRGEVLPIISLRKKFKLKERAIDEETRIIVALTSDIKVGLLCDSVSEILNIEEDQVEVVPKIVAGIDRRYIKSVAKVDKRMIVLVDVGLLINDEEKISLGEVVEKTN
jgi:purine-binding chemotaxis protein CheW